MENNNSFPLIVFNKVCSNFSSLCTWRWSEPSSSSPSTEAFPCAAWRRSTVCPPPTGTRSCPKRDAVRSASASTSPTDTHTTTRTPRTTTHTRTTEWAAAGSSGWCMTGNWLICGDGHVHTSLTYELWQCGQNNIYIFQYIILKNHKLQKNTSICLFSQLQFVF